MYVPPPTGGVLFLGFLYGKRRRGERRGYHLRGVTKKATQHTGERGDMYFLEGLFQMRDW
jgi:hypothetical protein